MLQYQVNVADYFGNVFRTYDYLTERSIQRFVGGVDKTRWFEELAPTDINAFYHPSLNQFSKFIATVIHIIQGVCVGIGGLRGSRT